MDPVTFRLPAFDLPIYWYGIFTVASILMGCVVGALEADGITDLIQQLPGSPPVRALSCV